MSLKQIIDIVTNDPANWLIIVVILMSLIQVAPLKLNPWTAIFKWISGIINKPILAKIDELNKRIDEVNNKINDIEKDLDDHIVASDRESLQRVRSSILSFGSSVISGRNYHKEQFDFIISECDKYERYCKEKEIVNGVADATIKEIRRVYSIRLSEDGFLKKYDESKSEM